MVTVLNICGVVLFVLINITSAQSPCKTPDNWYGKCIALQQCRPLIAILMKPSHLISTQERNFLRRTQCGRDSGNVLVCCPNTFTIDDLPTGKHCGVQVQEKIYGGERASLTEFPWLALIHYTGPNNRSGFYTGGSLIHENYVLTVANSIRGTAVVRLRYVIDSVRLGEQDMRTNPDCQEDECADRVVDIPVAEVTVHENYVPQSRSQENDIALIRLQSPAPLTSYVRPICLPILDLQNRNYDGLALMTAGFGRTESGPRSDVKLKLKLNGFNWEQCSNIYQRSGINLGDRVLCAGGEEGRDTCNGDTGSPLVAESINNESIPLWYIVGITSFGPRTCGTADFPGVYTRVDKYIDWILDHMRK